MEWTIEESIAILQSPEIDFDGNSRNGFSLFWSLTLFREPTDPFPTS